MKATGEQAASSVGEQLAPSFPHPTGVHLLLHRGRNGFDRAK